MSPSPPALSSSTAALSASLSSVVLFQSAASSVRENTTLAMPFIRSATSPLAVDQYAAMPW